MQEIALISKTKAIAKASAFSISSSVDDSVVTDSSGIYTFETLASGNYNLQGNYDNGKTDLKQLAILASKSVPAKKPVFH